VLVDLHDEDVPLEPNTGQLGAAMVEAIVEMTELGEKAGRTWLELLSALATPVVLVTPLFE
jgi:hypothetical protein